jgi:hypothetical protein
VGIALAAASEIAAAGDAAAHAASSLPPVRPYAQWSEHAVFGLLLLVAARRAEWRTPALAAATIACAFELGADSAPPKPRKALLALRTLLLGGLLREAVRADRWEARSGGAW